MKAIKLRRWILLGAFTGTAVLAAGRALIYFRSGPVLGIWEDIVTGAVIGAILAVVFGETISLLGWLYKSLRLVHKRGSREDSAKAPPKDDAE